MCRVVDVPLDDYAGVAVDVQVGDKDRFHAAAARSAASILASPISISASAPRELGITSTALAATVTGWRSEPNSLDPISAATWVPHDQPAVPSSTTTSDPVAVALRPIACLFESTCWPGMV